MRGEPNTLNGTCQIPMTKGKSADFSDMDDMTNKLPRNMNLTVFLLLKDL